MASKAKAEKPKRYRSEVRPLSQETVASTPLTEGMTRDLIRELRQPLSSIEAIAYYLEMTFPFDLAGPGRHLRQIQQLVDETNSILTNAGTVPASMAEKA